MSDQTGGQTEKQTGGSNPLASKRFARAGRYDYPILVAVVALCVTVLYAGAALVVAAVISNHGDEQADEVRTGTGVSAACRLWKVGPDEAAARLAFATVAEAARGATENPDVEDISGYFVDSIYLELVLAQLDRGAERAENAALTPDISDKAYDTFAALAAALADLKSATDPDDWPEDEGSDVLHIAKVAGPATAAAFDATNTLCGD